MHEWGPAAGPVPARGPARPAVPPRPVPVPDPYSTPLPADLLGETHRGPGLWEALRNWKWLVLLLTLVGGGLGYLAFLKQDPVYVSRALLRVERDALPGAEDVTNEKRGVGDRAQELRSQAVLAEALLSENLAQRPEFADSQSAMGQIAKRMEVVRLPDSDILDITYFGESREEPQAVLSAVLDAYQQFLAAGFGGRVKEILEYIRTARTELAAELATLREEYRLMKEKSPLVRGENGMVSPHDAEMRRYGAERDALRVQIARNKSRIDSLTEARGVVGNEAALSLLVKDFQDQDGSEPPKDLQIRDELFPLIRMEQELIQRYGPRHPDVSRVRAQIKATEEHLKDYLGDAVPKTPTELLDLYVKKLELELGTLGAEAAALDRRFEEERALAAADGNEELRLNTLGKEIAEKEALFTGINGKLNELGLTPEDVQGFSVRLLERPGPAYESQAAMPLFAGAGAAAGFLLGFGIAFLLTSLDSRFVNAADIKAATGAAVLAHTPVISPKVKRKKRTGPPLAGADDFVTQEASPTLLAVHPENDPGGRYMEAMRRARAGLFFAGEGGDVQVVQVTSPSPEDGKSTTAANLAVAAADSGRRTLLMDCDLRRPVQHTLFGIDPEAPGVVEVMFGEVELDDALRDVGVDGLSVLPCGKPPANASELLDSGHFAEFVEMLRGKFDLILIDSPPVLAVADPLSIAPRADRVILAMRLDRKTRERVESVVNQLEAAGGTLAGTIVTGVEAAETEKGAYKYDSYAGYAYAAGKTDPYAQKKYASYRGQQYDRARTKRPRATSRGVVRPNVPAGPEEGERDRRAARESRQTVAAE